MNRSDVVCVIVLIGMTIFFSASWLHGRNNSYFLIMEHHRENNVVYVRVGNYGMDGLQTISCRIGQELRSELIFLERGMLKNITFEFSDLGEYEVWVDE